MGWTALLRNVAAGLFSLPVGLALAALLDRGLGRLLELPTLEDLVLPALSKARYVTPEFDFVVEANHLGFRGPPPTPGSGYRVALVGDSFTYGWGVEFQSTWGHLLENGLRRLCPTAEVANLGRGGASPAQYAAIARRALPVLRPDLVLVAVLQGDDLAQLAEDAASVAPVRWNVRLVSRAGRMMRRAYPNLAHLAIAWSARHPIDVSSFWRDQVAALLRNLSPEERTRLEAMDPTFRRLFVEGEINPAMPLLAIRKPDHYARTLDPDPTEGPSFQRLVESLRSIRQAAEAVGADVLVLAMPSGMFVSEESLSSYAALGLLTSPEFLRTRVMDAVIRRGAEEVGVDFLEVTSAFRSREETLFFRYDGHMNEAGHVLLAQAISPVLRSRLARAEVAGAACRGMPAP